MGHSESALLGAAARHSACDITQPVKVDAQLEHSLEAYRSAWFAVARYQVVYTAAADWNDKEVMAEWLHHEEASAICERLNHAITVANPALSCWTRSRYCIELHVPPVRKVDVAEVGDLLLHELVVPHGEFSLSDTYVFRQFLVAAQVTAVDANGHITAFRDRDGEHLRPPRKPQAISREDLDVEGTLKAIADAEKARGHWAGEFCKNANIQAFLVRFQRLKAPVIRSALQELVSS